MALAAQRPAAGRLGSRHRRVGRQRRLHRPDRLQADRRRVAGAHRISLARRPAVRRARRSGGSTALAQLSGDPGPLRPHLRCVRPRLGHRPCVRGPLGLLPADRKRRQGAADGGLEPADLHARRGIDHRRHVLAEARLGDPPGAASDASQPDRPAGRSCRSRADAVAHADRAALPVQHGGDGGAAGPQRCARRAPHAGPADRLHERLASPHAARGDDLGRGAPARPRATSRSSGCAWNRD